MFNIRGEHGASMVEFALLLPLLLMIIVGIIEFGFAFHRTQSIEASAREGARLASIGADESAIRARVIETESLFDPADVQILDVTSGDPITGGNRIPCEGRVATREQIEIRVSVPASPEYQIAIPFASALGPTTYSGTGVFLCEKE